MERKFFHLPALRLGFRRLMMIFLKSPNQFLRLVKYQTSIQNRNWISARKLLISFGESSIAMRDHRTLADLFLSAARFGDYKLADQWAITHAKIVGWINSSSWLGQDLSSRAIQIYFKESERDGVSSGINLAGWVEIVGQRAHAGQLFVDARLVPFFQRTLPAVSVLPWTKNIPGEEITVKAKKLLLRTGLGIYDSNINLLFKPVIPEKVLSASLRCKYKSDTKRRLIGLSWFSAQSDKDVPPISLWNELARDLKEFLFLDL